MQPTVLLAVWQQLSLPVIFPSLCHCLVSVCCIHLSTQVTASLLLPNEPEGETRERKRKRVYLELYISFKTKSWIIQWTSPVHFCKTVLCDLSKNLVPYSWPIRYKWNVTRELFTNVLPSLPWVFFRLLIKTFWCCSSCRIQCTLVRQIKQVFSYKHMYVRMQGHWGAYFWWSVSASRSQPLSVSIHLICFSSAPPTLSRLLEVVVSVKVRIPRKGRSRSKEVQRKAWSKQLFTYIVFLICNSINKFSFFIS